MADPARVHQLLDELQAERERAARIRAATTLVVLGMFLIFATNTWVRIQRFDGEALMVNLEKQASTRVWPLVSRELDAVAADAVPALSEAMAAEAETLIPRLGEKLSAEAVVFEQEVSQRMKVSLDAALASELAQHEAQLKDRFPELKTDSVLYDDLARRLEVTSRQWAQEQLDTVFSDHIRVLQSINESVQALREQADAERAKTGDVTPDDALLLLTEIFNARLNGED